MKAVFFDAHGGNEVLEYGERPGSRAGTRRSARARCARPP